MMDGEIFVSKPLTSEAPMDFANKVVYQFSGDIHRAVSFLQEAVKFLVSPSFSRDEKEKSPFTQAPAIENLNEKFLSDKSNFVLKYGGKKDFMAGLESYIGRPKNPNILQCMREEHNLPPLSIQEFSPSNNPQLVTTPAEEWLFVVNPDAYKQQAMVKGRWILERRIATVDDLMRDEIAVKANLTGAEVIAARLYTGPMFKLYNDILRNPAGPGQQIFVYTIHAFASCIVKLSRVHRITTLYRGIKGGVLPRAFLEPDEYGARGGVEYGFMSTTTEKCVAYDYAQSADGSTRKAAVIYEIDEGAIDRGADVSWLSQFPQENEVVFPPLTNLEVFGDPQVVDDTIVTKLRVNINLRTLTVDEIVEKSRTQFLHMIEWYMEEVRMAYFDFDPSAVLPSWLDDFTSFKDKMTSIDGSRFNEHEFYRKAVDDALDLKEGTIQKVHVLKLLGEVDPAETHSAAVFTRTINRLRATNASKFADPMFVMRYVAPVHGSVDKDGNTRLQNFKLLWNLPVQKGSWAALVHAMTAVAPIRVTTRKTWAQWVRDLVFSLGFVRVVWQQILGHVIMDSLLGFDGIYFCVGMSAENGKPFYQLAKRSNALSSKYIYHKNGRWYIGSVLDSEWADLRSVSEDDGLPSDVLCWGRTTAPVLMAYVASKCDYREDEVVRVEMSPEHRDFGVAGDVEEGDGSAGKAVHDSRASSSSFSSSPMHLSVASMTFESATGSGVRSPKDEVASNAVNLDLDGQKWAFVHRMIEEQRERDRDLAVSSRSGKGARGSDLDIHVDSLGMAELTLPLLPLSKSELHSIAVFCEQSKCPLPKDVSGCLLEEGTTAALASALLTLGLHATIFTGAILFLILGLESFFGLIGSENFVIVSWFARGLFAGCAVLGFVVLPSLTTVLLGRTSVSMCISSTFVVCLGILSFYVFLMTSADVEPTTRGIMTFVAEGVFFALFLSVLFALFVG